MITLNMQFDTFAEWRKHYTAATNLQNKTRVFVTQMPSNIECLFGFCLCIIQSVDSAYCRDVWHVMYSNEACTRTGNASIL